MLKHRTKKSGAENLTLLPLLFKYNNLKNKNQQQKFKQQ
jgi:hypothetical protein